MIRTCSLHIGEYIFFVCGTETQTHLRLNLYINPTQNVSWKAAKLQGNVAQQFRGNKGISPNPIWQSAGGLPCLPFPSSYDLNALYDYHAYFFLFAVLVLKVSGYDDVYANGRRITRWAEGQRSGKLTMWNLDECKSLYLLANALQFRVCRFMQNGSVR